MNDQLNQLGQLSNSQDGYQTNSRRYDRLTVLRLGQDGRTSLATAGLLVNFDVRAIWRSGLSARSPWRQNVACCMLHAV